MPKEKTNIEHVKNEHFWCIKTKNKNFLIRRNGKVHITGNCHGSLRAPETKRIDVGVDTTPDYAPYGFDEIKRLMDKREYQPVDHHKKRK